MLCTDCEFATRFVENMMKHYKDKHPNVKHPRLFFTKFAKSKSQLKGSVVR